MNERLDRLLALAREIREPTTSLGAEVRRGLEATSALSAAGVELALREHLEVEIGAPERAALIAWARGSGERLAAPASCHVVLSAHVCTAALRALALALESAEQVVVRPSRRDPVLASVLVRELARRGVTITLSTELSAQRGDVVHFYGADATLAQLTRSLPAGVRLVPHGTGLGVALVGADAELALAAGSLARDVVPFDQRGCLSPRVALAIGERSRAGDLARALASALGRLAEQVPRGALGSLERAELSRFASAYQAIGELFEERDCLVAFAEGLSHLELPPAARALLVVPVADVAEARALLAPLEPALTTVGWSGAQARGWLDDALRPAAGVRLSPLGAMQRPPLDGPVDRRGGPTMSCALRESAH